MYHNLSICFSWKMGVGGVVVEQQQQQQQQKETNLKS